MSENQSGWIFKPYSVEELIKRDLDAEAAILEMDFRTDLENEPDETTEQLEFDLGLPKGEIDEV